MLTFAAWAMSRTVVRSYPFSSRHFFAAASRSSRLPTRASLAPAPEAIVLRKRLAQMPKALVQSPDMNLKPLLLTAVAGLLTLGAGTESVADVRTYTGIRYAQADRWG